MDKGKHSCGQRTTEFYKNPTLLAERLIKEECEEFEIPGEKEEEEEEAMCASSWEEGPQKDQLVKEEFEMDAVSLVVVSEASEADRPEAGSQAVSLLEQTEGRVKAEPEGCEISRYGDISGMTALMAEEEEEQEEELMCQTLKEEPDPEAVTWETSSLSDAPEQETGSGDDSFLLGALMKTVAYRSASSTAATDTRHPGWGGTAGTRTSFQELSRRENTLRTSDTGAVWRCRRRCSPAPDVRSPSPWSSTCTGT